MRDYIRMTNEDLQTCARCRHPRHEDGKCSHWHSDRKRSCVCMHFIPIKKRYTMARLMTCPFGSHPRRLMIPINEEGNTTTYQCPRCKKIMIEDEESLYEVPGL